MEDDDYSFMSLLRPVFHPVKFAKQPKGVVPPSLVDLAALRVVQDSSMCQQARFLVPSSILEDLARIALLQGRDRSLVQLLKGWSTPVLVLKHFIPGFFQGQLLFHSYESKRACARRARDLLKVLMTALVESKPEKLTHVDLTGFFAVFKFLLRNVFTGQKKLRQLRKAGLRVTLDTIDYHKVTNCHKDNFSRAVHVDDLFNSQLERILSGQELDLSLVLYISLPGGVQAQGVPDLLHMLDLLSRLTNLQAMELSDLMMTYRGETNEERTQVMNSLGEMFKGLQKLKRLDIRNSIPSEGGGFARLSPELKQLEYLNLSYNTLSNGDLSSLTALPALNHLELSGCKVEAGIQDTFRRVLTQLQNLQVLELDTAHSLLSNIGTHQFLQTIRSCSRLEVLVLLEHDFDLQERDLFDLGLVFMLVTKLNWRLAEEEDTDDGSDEHLVAKDENGYRVETNYRFIRATRLEYCVPDHVKNDPYLIFKYSVMS